MTDTNHGAAGWSIGTDGAELAASLNELGAATTPQVLEARGVKRLREFTPADLQQLVTQAVDRALERRSHDDARRDERNALVEDTTQDVESHTDLDPHARIALLERRLRKLAEALDRSERALADVLDDVDTGLPAARGYVNALPDDHPLRQRTAETFALLVNGRGRALRAEPTEAETRRARERRQLLAALAEVNQIDATPLSRADHAALAATPEATTAAPRQVIANRNTVRESTPQPKGRSFADLAPDDLRLDLRNARPFRSSLQFRRTT
jgi:hypothetical protein